MVEIEPGTLGVMMVVCSRAKKSFLASFGAGFCNIVWLGEEVKDCFLLSIG